ncbi:MAG: META domain-containing protein [Acidimicrobiales bacterium]
MPDPFDVDAARRALDDVPAPDLWSEVERRAAGASVVALEADDHRTRRPGRWLAAVAAVAVAAVGVATVLVDDDGDQGLEMSPTTTAPEPGTTVEGPDCLVGISGEPIMMEEGSADPPLFGTGGQPEGQLVTHTMLGTQVAELHVPGLVLDDLLGERVEEVELRRGTATVWFGADFVQVRWFSGAQEPCESFTVTVAGGTEDGNRHAAVDFAERILLPSDLGDLAAASLEGTDWALESSTVAGVTTDGSGLPFAFAGGEATWTDGCNSFGALFDQPSPTSLVLDEVGSTQLPCPTSPTSQALAAVMGADAIEVTFGSGRDIVVLSAGDTTLVLRPA